MRRKRGAYWRTLLGRLFTFAIYVISNSSVFKIRLNELNSSADRHFITASSKLNGR